MYSNYSVEFKFDKYNRLSPVSCYKLNIIAIYCTTLLILCLFSNGLLIWLILKYKKLRTPLNILILTLAFYNLIGSLLEFPFVIHSNFYCK